MATIDHLARAAGTGGTECVSSSLSLFDLPMIENAIERCYYQPYDPINAIVDSANTVNFTIGPSEDVTDANQSYVKVTVKVVKGDGTNLDAYRAAAPAAGGNPAVTANSVGFCQNPRTSLFSNVSIRLSDELLSDNYNTTNILSYFQLLLNYGSEARNSLLALGGWYDEKSPSARDAMGDIGVGDGFKKRAQLTQLSREATFVAAFHNPIFSQARYLPAMLPLTIEFLKAPASWVLLSNDPAANYKYKITSMKVMMRRIKLKSSFKLDLEKSLLKEPAVYPITQSYVKPLFIDAALKSVTFQNLFQDKSLPSLVAIAFCRQDDYRGRYEGSCFQFDHFSLTSIKISVDSESYSYTPNYTSVTQPNWVEPYLGLFHHQLKVDHGSAISYDAFKSDGFCIYVFDMGQETSITQDHTTMKRMGANCRLDISFDPASNNPGLTCLVMVEHNNERILIDGSRRVLKDYY